MSKKLTFDHKKDYKFTADQLKGYPEDYDVRHEHKADADNLRMTILREYNRRKHVKDILSSDIVSYIRDNKWKPSNTPIDSRSKYPSFDSRVRAKYTELVEELFTNHLGAGPYDYYLRKHFPTSTNETTVSVDLEEPIKLKSKFPDFVQKGYGEYRRDNGREVKPLLYNKISEENDEETSSAPEFYGFKRVYDYALGDKTIFHGLTGDDFKNPLHYYKRFNKALPGLRYDGTSFEKTNPIKYNELDAEARANIKDAYKNLHANARKENPAKKFLFKVGYDSIDDNYQELGYLEHAVTDDWEKRMFRFHTAGITASEEVFPKPDPISSISNNTAMEFKDGLKAFDRKSIQEVNTDGQYFGEELEEYHEKRKEFIEDPAEALLYEDDDIQSHDAALRLYGVTPFEMWNFLDSVKGPDSHKFVIDRTDPVKLEAVQKMLTDRALAFLDAKRTKSLADINTFQANYEKIKQAREEKEKDNRKRKREDDENTSSS